MFKTSKHLVLNPLFILVSNGNGCSFCLIVGQYSSCEQKEWQKTPPTSPKRREAKPYFRVRRDSTKQWKDFSILEMFFLHVFKQKRVLYLPIYKNVRLKNTLFPSQEEKDMTDLLTVKWTLYSFFLSYSNQVMKIRYN